MISLPQLPLLAAVQVIRMSFISTSMSWQRMPTCLHIIQVSQVHRDLHIHTHARTHHDTCIHQHITL